MRNHGDSPRSAGARLRGDGGRSRRDASPGSAGAADLLGHSMGGKAAMVLALTEPARVRRLIVADMAPVAYDAQPARATSEAMQAVDLAAVARRADADAALAAAVPEPGCARSSLQSLALGADGAPLEAEPRRARRARCRGSWAFPSSAGASTAPALFLTGRRSDYVRPDALAAASAGCSPHARSVGDPRRRALAARRRAGGLRRGGGRVPRRGLTWPRGTRLRVDRGVAMRCLS